MIGRRINTSPAVIDRKVLQRLTRLDAARRYPGHSHFWRRAFSRRQFIQAAGAAAGILGTGHWTAAHAAVPGDFPKPIPGGFTFPPLTEVFHNFAPGVFDPLDTDRSGIFDFNGHIGYAVIDGGGTGKHAGHTARLAFECDVRLMQGVYIATDGKYRQATFGLL